MDDEDDYAPDVPPYVDREFPTREERPVTVPPRLWSRTHDVTELFTWREERTGWAMSDGPWERLTHYTVGGTMTENGPMILRNNIPGWDFAKEAAEAARLGHDFYAIVPNVYRLVY